MIPVENYTFSGAYQNSLASGAESLNYTVAPGYVGNFSGSELNRVVYSSGGTLYLIFLSNCSGFG